MLKTAGLYYEQVKAYMDNFKNIRIYLTDDLKEDPKSLVQDMYSFLGVDSSFTPNLDRKFNQGMITTNPIVSFILRISYRNKVLSKLIKTGLLSSFLKKFCLLEKPQMKSDTKKYLIKYYKEEVQRVRKAFREGFDLLERI